jgi:hypothetical protein
MKEVVINCNGYSQRKLKPVCLIFCSFRGVVVMDTSGEKRKPFK